MINKRIKTINQKGNHNIAIQDSHITICYYSKFDEFKRLAEKGDYNGAAQILKELHEEAGKIHPFYIGGRPSLETEVSRFQLQKAKACSIL